VLPPFVYTKFAFPFIFQYVFNINYVNTKHSHITWKYNYLKERLKYRYLLHDNLNFIFGETWMDLASTKHPDCV